MRLMTSAEVAGVNGASRVAEMRMASMSPQITKASSSAFAGSLARAHGALFSM